MVTAYDQIKSRFSAAPSTWLITGVAGFIDLTRIDLIAAYPVVKNPGKSILTR